MKTNLTLLGEHIPAGWSLVPVNGSKRPVDPVTGMGLKGWQNSCINLTTFPFDSSHVQAIGVLAGSKSNGLLVVDIDSDDGIRLLENLTGRSVCDFPKTISCTSGKPGTQKLFIMYQMKIIGVVFVPLICRDWIFSGTAAKRS